MRVGKIFAFVMCALAFGVHDDGFAAAAKKTKVAKQAAIQNGTKVRTKMDASGLYSQECYDAYFGCMDQFCITDNTNGGTCTCSDENEKYEQQLKEVQKMMEEAERIKTEEVERVQAGAKADIIFNGERKYDESGNAVTVAASTEARKNNFLSMLEEDDEDEEEDYGLDAIADKTGAALFSAANKLCREQIPESCENDYSFLRQLYSKQITSDCKGFENSVKTKMAEAKVAMSEAEADVRAALKESFDEANKYGRGECMVEFKKCMLTEDACGKDWIHCVSTIASENMQNNSAAETFEGQVETIDRYSITKSTMESLDSKRYVCERVLDQCVSVRDFVWTDFLREAAPTIKVAESKIESQFRQSCLSNISTCIQKACKDDIVGKGTATMDACLSRPDMARSFCKVEIEPCERMEPQIWSYVQDKLAAMRVDACTEEVKACLTADTRCGADFTNCVGMDYEYLHDMCPIDSLVVCKAADPKFSFAKLDSMLMGLYLNIDNSLLENCQNLVEKRMAEICGSTTDCNKYAADDTIGTSSIASKKIGTVYRITGMISFGNIKMGDLTTAKDDYGLKVGQIDIQDYVDNLWAYNKNADDADGIIKRIEAELQNIQGTINRTVAMIESDQEIQWCVNGRNLSNINGQGNKNNTTEARFPHLLDGVKTTIAVAALRQAQTNYNKKFNEEMAKAAAGADLDMAQYMCQKMAGFNANDDDLEKLDNKDALGRSYAILYDAGSGLQSSVLATGGVGTQGDFGKAQKTRKDGTVKKEYYQGGTEISKTAIFNRQTRMCHICSTTTVKNCKVKGFGRTSDCTTDVGQPVCEDVPL